MKNMTKKKILCIVVATLLAGFALYYGYRSRPVAKTTEDFKVFAQKELGANMFYDLVEDNGELEYTLSDTALDDSGLSWQGMLARRNGASFNVNLKKYGSFQFPIGEEQLIGMGWTAPYGSLTYRNAKEELQLYESRTMIQLTMQRENIDCRSYTLDTVVWPKFEISGINNNSNMDDIIKKLGAPFRIHFQSGENPCAKMSYFVFVDDVYQNGAVEITINTAKNRIEMIELTYFRN